MLPTPSTSHVPYDRVYEPAEDSFLLLDTLSSPSETAFLANHFPSSSPTSTSPTPTPLILELGPGSGVVLAFLTAHAQTLFSRRDILTLGVDINAFACAATRETVQKAVREDAVPTRPGSGAGYFLGAAQGDLTTALREHSVDVLVFNPPYVPTAELPTLPATLAAPATTEGGAVGERKTTYEQDSALLALSYAGGRDGMEITDRVIDALPGVLSGRGVAYLLLCAQNKPEEVKGRIRGLGKGEGGIDGRRWMAETVGTSGRQAGWEKLQVMRIWRE